MSFGRNALLANVAALLPWPLLKLLDQLNRGCGDGLCGSISGLLVLLLLAVASVVFVVRSARRHEQPAWMRLTPLLLWGIAVAVLAL